MIFAAHNIIKYSREMRFWENEEVACIVDLQTTVRCVECGKPLIRDKEQKVHDPHKLFDASNP